MKQVGALDQFPELESIADAIFAHKVNFALRDGTRLKTRIFKGTLYAVDHNGTRYVEQNPHTSSAYAERVREHSARILWVIRTHKKVVDAAHTVQYVPCSEEWLGRVEDGQVYMK